MNIGELKIKHLNRSRKIEGDVVFKQPAFFAAIYLAIMSLGQVLGIAKFPLSFVDGISVNWSSMIILIVGTMGHFLYCTARYSKTSGVSIVHDYVKRLQTSENISFDELVDRIQTSLNVSDEWRSTKKALRPRVLKSLIMEKFGPLINDYLELNLLKPDQMIIHTPDNKFYDTMKSISALGIKPENIVTVDTGVISIFLKKEDAQLAELTMNLSNSLTKRHDFQDYYLIKHVYIKTNEILDFIKLCDTDKELDGLFKVNSAAQNLTGSVTSINVVNSSSIVPSSGAWGVAQQQAQYYSGGTCSVTPTFGTVTPAATGTSNKNKPTP